MSGLNSKKSAEKTILYGLITIAVLVMILAGVFLAIFFSGYTRGAAKSRQEATAPVEDQVLQERREQMNIYFQIVKFVI